MVLSFDLSTYPESTSQCNLRRNCQDLFQPYWDKNKNTFLNVSTKPIDHLAARTTLAWTDSEQIHSITQFPNAPCDTEVTFVVKWPYFKWTVVGCLGVQECEIKSHIYSHHIEMYMFSDFNGVLILIFHSHIHWVSFLISRVLHCNCLRI